MVALISEKRQDEPTLPIVDFPVKVRQLSF